MSEPPTGWAETTLGEMVRWGSGGTPRRNVARYYGGSIPWAIVGDLNDGLVTTTAGTITDDGLAESSARLVRPGTVLIAMYGSIGKLGIAGIEMATNQAIGFADPRQGLDSRFLFWYLRAERRNLAHAGKGATQKNISQTVLRSWPLPLPPLSEQRRIVAAIEEHLSRLDAADASISPALQRTEVLRSALVTTLVERGEWPRTPWKQAGRSQNGRAFPSRDYSANGIRLLRPGNLHVSGRVEWDTKNTRHLPESYADEHPRFVVGENELVMNLTAQSLKDEFLGRVCLTQTGERCLLNQRIARLTPNEAVPRFVMYAFKSRRFRAFVNSLNKGSLIQHMFTSQLADYELPLPPLEDQRRIVQEIDERLSRIDAMRASIERAQRRSAALRAAILERAFRGELVPQDPADEPAEALLARIRNALDS